MGYKRAQVTVEDVMPNLLLADDKAVARQALRSILKEELPSDMTCTEAEDGMDAVEKAEALRPDVAVLDLVMPRLNGLKAAEKIARSCPKTKVLVVSMYDPKPIYDKLKEAGVSGFVPKASAGLELVPAIESLLGGKTFFGLPSSFPPGGRRENC
jgi:DNA-binding NarL/FixJ family response regulator